MKYFRSFITALNSQAKRTQIAIAAVTMLLGILIVTQLRVHQSATQALQNATESDLTQIVSKLDGEINTLRVEAADLRLQLFKIEQASNNSAEVMTESSKNLNNLKIIAGLTKVYGPGIKALVTDEDATLRAYDMVDIITELRVGGAEAISINGIRIVAATGISETQEAIFINQKQVAAPYEVLAIGNPEVIHDALVIPGGIRDKLSSLTGVSLYITKDAEIKINAASSNKVSNK